MSTQLDSREGTIQLDYDNLIISTPTTFTKSLTLTPGGGNTFVVNGASQFNGTAVFGSHVVFSGTVTGLPWPRLQKITGTAFSYTQPAAANIQLQVQTINTNDFIAPIPSAATFFTVNNNGLITTTLGNMYMTVEATISASGSFNTNAATYLFSLNYTPSGGSVTSVQDEVIQPGAAGPYQSVVTLRTRMLVAQGDTFVVNTTGTTNMTYTLQYKIIVDKAFLA